MTQDDHDLLIQIDTKLDRALLDINLIASEKASQVEVSDHETRIRRLERWGFGACGVLFVLEIIVVWIKATH